MFSLFTVICSFKYSKLLLVISSSAHLRRYYIIHLFLAINWRKSAVQCVQTSLPNTFSDVLETDARGPWGLNLLASAVGGSRPPPLHKQANIWSWFNHMSLEIQLTAGRAFHMSMIWPQVPVHKENNGEAILWEDDCSWKLNGFLSITFVQSVQSVWMRLLLTTDCDRCVRFCTSMCICHTAPFMWSNGWRWYGFFT